MPSLAEAFVRVGLNTRGLSGALGRLKSMLTGTFRTITSGLMAGPLGMLMGGGPAAGPLFGGYKMIQAAGQFQHVMAQVATMLDEPQKHMAAFERGIRDLSIETGKSLDDLGLALYGILSAGVAPEKAMAMLTQSSKLAVGGVASVTDSVNAMLTLMETYGDRFRDAADASDFLFTIVRRGRTNMAELAPKIGMIISAAESAGLSVDNFGASLALLTRATGNTDSALTALQAIAATFLTSKGTGEGAALWEKKFGTRLDANTLKLEGMGAVLEKLGKLSKGEVATIFPNLRAIRGIFPAIKKMQDFSKDLAAMQNRAGATQRAYDTMMATFLAKWDKFKRAIADFAVGIGGPIMKALEPLVEGLTKEIPRITAAIEKFLADNARRWKEWGDNIRQAWNNLWENIARSGVGDKLAKAGKGIMDAMGEVFNFAKLMTADPGGAWELLKNRIAHIGQYLSNIMVGALIGGAQAFMEAMLYVIRLLTERLTDLFIAAGEAIAAAITPGGKTGAEAFGESMGKSRQARVERWLGSHPEEIPDEYREAWQDSIDEVAALRKVEADRQAQVDRHPAWAISLAGDKAAKQRERERYQLKEATRARELAERSLGRRMWLGMKGDELNTLLAGQRPDIVGAFKGPVGEWRKRWESSDEAKRLAKEEARITARMRGRAEEREAARQTRDNAARIWGPAAELLKPENWVDWGQALGKRLATAPAIAEAAGEGAKKKKEPFGRGGFAGVTELGRQFQEAIFSAEQKRRERERTEAAKKTKTNTETLVKQGEQMLKKAATGFVAFSALTP